MLLRCPHGFLCLISREYHGNNAGLIAKNKCIGSNNFGIMQEKALEKYRKMWFL